MIFIILFLSSLITLNTPDKLRDQNLDEKLKGDWKKTEEDYFDARKDVWNSIEDKKVKNHFCERRLKMASAIYL